MSDYDKTCEVCGTPVRVVGDATKSYESAYDTLKERCERLVSALVHIAEFGDSYSACAEYAREALKPEGER